MTQLSLAIEVNTALKTLNLYRNIIDIDGARSLKTALSKNNSLEFIDLSFNRLREKGLMAITDGIASNPNSQIKSLGLRSNFIADDAFNYFFNTIVFKKTGKHQISEVFIMLNQVTEHCMFEAKKKLEEANLRIYVDMFEKTQYMDSKRNDQSIWISPIPLNIARFPEKLRQFF